MVMDCNNEALVSALAWFHVRVISPMRSIMVLSGPGCWLGYIIDISKPRSTRHRFRSYQVRRLAFSMKSNSSWRTKCTICAPCSRKPWPIRYTLYFGSTVTVGVLVSSIYGPIGRSLYPFLTRPHLSAPLSERIASIRCLF